MRRPPATAARVAVGSPPSANGVRQVAVAMIRETTIRPMPATTSSQATTRHRGDLSRPVGNHRNMNGSAHTAIGQIHFENQARNRPPGSPGRASRACTAQASPNTLSEAARPATRNSQPIRLAGRRTASRIPSAGRGIWPRISRTSAKLQDGTIDVGGTSRSTNMSTSAPINSPIDRVPRSHAHRRAVADAPRTIPGLCASTRGRGSRLAERSRVESRPEIGGASRCGIGRTEDLVATWSGWSHQPVRPGRCSSWITGVPLGSSPPSDAQSLANLVRDQAARSSGPR